MADDPDVNRVVWKRTADRSVLKNLLNQGRDIIINTEDKKEASNDLESLISVIENKFQITKEQDLEIVDLIHEDLIDGDTTRAAEFEIESEKGKRIINSFSEENRPKDKESPISRSGSLNVSKPKKPRVNLPKIIFKKFSGNPIKWQQFYDTFKATIDSNEYLSDVEKFSTVLEGQAYQSLQGFNVTKDDYKRASEILSERYGNPQLIISNHMTKILKLQALQNCCPVNELRKLFDNISSHVRSPITLGIGAEHYGPLVIPKILEKLPAEICLVISRKLGTNNWCVDDILEILKHKTAARENCDFLKTHSENKFEKSEQVKNNKQRRATVDALLAGSHKRSLKCAFCSQNRYHDQCNVVTDCVT